MFEVELQEFGQTLGVKDLRLNDAGCVRFVFEKDRLIQIEKTADDIFFFILQEYELDPLPFQVYAQALAIANLRTIVPFQVQAIAKTGHDVGLITRLKEEECTQQSLYKVFKYLLQCIEKLLVI